ncbi:cyclic pyranopterin monophosphate synthase MoaC [Micromonospora sp. NBRC 107095]|uniref:cyclic pyranopterin monophosphate synthase MoaC n=1 Tax=Micromonospora sp. NBRC 107095 TaxID=3032209 RepID=UPI0024A299E7|nr:cyclic pyranopterin monophosphate synthase MoaC [Micromonospora sp. NBRC 107095]GLZ60910.1 cyclic pyranopterin monophosphate synthase accessory protein 1 [Micromonospora sp. NBRC 107095]
MKGLSVDSGVAESAHPLTHLDATGAAHMVEISPKPITYREAIASGIVFMAPETLKLVTSGKGAKGDVLATARLAGITGAKRTSDLIPLCHPLFLESVAITFESLQPNRLRVVARAATTGRTGVEMEVLTAVAVAALTVYDMCKSADKEMSIGEVRVEEKSGGKSGYYRRQA